MNTTYKKLNIYEKASLIFNRHFSFIPYRESCVVYLKALRNGNFKIVNEFEDFGNCVNSMIVQKMSCQKKTEQGQLSFNFDA